MDDLVACNKMKAGSLGVAMTEPTNDERARKPRAALRSAGLRLLIKDYILERVLPPPTGEGLSPDDALRQLEDLLKPRIEAAEQGDVVAKSVKEIFEDVRRHYSTN